MHNFFFNDTATTEIYTLSLHDALPISNEMGDQPLNMRAGKFSDWNSMCQKRNGRPRSIVSSRPERMAPTAAMSRSEEHTSELQSRLHLVCRLLLEKKNNTYCTLSAHSH